MNLKDTCVLELLLNSTILSSLDVIRPRVTLFVSFVFLVSEGSRVSGRPMFVISILFKIRKYEFYVH